MTAELAETASTFPELNGPKKEPSSMQTDKSERSNLARQAIAIIDRISPPQPEPTSLESAMASGDAAKWAKARAAEVLRHTDDHDLDA